MSKPFNCVECGGHGCHVCDPSPTTNYDYQPLMARVERIAQLLITKESPMSVRAKFKCVESTQSLGGSDTPITTVKLQPVYGSKDDPTNENAEFYKWTPSGSITLGVLNPAIEGKFKVGESYYVDFTPSGAR
jgi:hypothetical protein